MPIVYPKGLYPVSHLMKRWKAVPISSAQD